MLLIYFSKQYIHFVKNEYDLFYITKFFNWNIFLFIYDLKYIYIYLKVFLKNTIPLKFSQKCFAIFSSIFFFSF